MLSVGNCFVGSNWLHLLSVGNCFGQELQIQLEKRKKEKKEKTYSRVFKTQLEKHNVRGFSCISKHSTKIVYSHVLENSATIDLSLQLHFKNAIGPGYSRVLNAAQSGSIATFFTKCNYRSQLIGGGKTQLQGVKNAAIGGPLAMFIKTQL